MSWLPPERPRKAVKPQEDAKSTEPIVKNPGRRREIKIGDIEEAFLNLSISDEQDLGSEGDKLKVITNFFDLETLPKFIVHEYMVEFKPECVRKRNRLQILNTFRESLLGPFAYDGMKMFVVKQLVTNDEGSEGSQVLLRKCIFRGKEYELSFKHVNVVSPNTLPYVQLLGVLFRDKLYRLKMRSINRNLFELGIEHRSQEEGIYVFPGVKSSILPRGKNGQLMLCLDKLHKVINSSTLDEYMYSFERWDQHDKDEVKRFLVGQSVVTRYNMNSYRIDDVDFNKTIDSTFEVEGGRKVSYRQYYKEHYNETLRCHDLPLLAVRSRKPDGSRSAVYLVPELCHLSGVNTGAGGNLNIMRSLAKHCGPLSRMNYIKGVLKRIEESVIAEQDKTGLHWGLKIHSKPKEIEVRCFPPLQPIMDEGRTSRNWPQACNSNMLRSVPLENWLVIHTRNVDVNSLLDGIWDTMNRLGMKPKDPIIKSLDSDGVRTVHQCLQLMRSQEQLKDKQLVLFVQQDRALDRNYKEVKKVLSQHFGLVSQFVRGRNCKTKPAIYQKIALQMGCKIGCEPWTMQIPFKRPTMVFGVDCYHSRGAQSVAACVATLNRFCSKFYSRCCMQQEGQELVSVIGGFVADAFDKFHKLNKGRYPEQLIIYRDGVGDGQLVYIRDHEIEQISHIAKSLNQNCSITFIVVKKHGSARFFVRQGADGIANPPAGTIVDHTVTNANWKDFYLIPQKVTQGTATPSHFNVLMDEANFSMDFIQDMTYKLCHMYYNWTGPIRVPAVCQYAHKLAFLVGNCMSAEPTSESMHNKLYYL